MLKQGNWGGVDGKRNDSSRKRAKILDRNFSEESDDIESRGSDWCSRMDQPLSGLNASFLGMWLSLALGKSAAAADLQKRGEADED